MPKITYEIDWGSMEEEVFLRADNFALHLRGWYDCPDIQVRRIDYCLGASEALFGFVGWLTTRTERTVMSGHDDMGVVADLVKEFCEANQLDEPRTGWSENLVHPRSEE